MNLRSPVLRTGALPWNYLRHIPTQKQISLDFHKIVIQDVSKGQVNPFGGDSGSYFEQKIIIHFFRIRPHFQVTRT